MQSEITDKTATSVYFVPDAVRCDILKPTPFNGKRLTQWDVLPKSMFYCETIEREWGKTQYDKFKISLKSCACITQTFLENY